ncbi:Peptidase propeptide and YPEB domain-containing protein [Roseovarius litoreus]|uniref:Peptidase propeptide and YPEB domain-containing protein n=1 Tax=Roseovarius litoreus TaxID=1155722 RepID=A0A1M7C8P2_9RHOB|nr:PepSY domain-containing protein [Roseovarius litoreus]SHL63547.1 Peptidase propeptide and YPEB domain-containing protein [Roseovarius litoreus]
MNTKLIAGGALTGLVLAGGFAGMLSAQSAADATGLTKEQIIEIALAEVPGEVTEVELERYLGQQIYEIEILGEDGVEMEIEIAAETGEVLKVEAEDDDDQEDYGKDDDDHDDDS